MSTNVDPDLKSEEARSMIDAIPHYTIGTFNPQRTLAFINILTSERHPKRYTSS